MCKPFLRVFIVTFCAGTASSRFPGGLTTYENDMRRLLTAVCGGVML